MNVSMQCGPLIEALKLIERLLWPKKRASKRLMHVQLLAVGSDAETRDPGGLFLIAANGDEHSDRRIKLKISGAVVQQPFQAVVYGSDLLEAALAAPSMMLHAMPVSATELGLWSGRSTWKLAIDPDGAGPMLADDGFDVAGCEGPQTSVEVSAAKFRAAALRTAFATDPESSRYALGGVCFHWHDGAFTAVATNGRMLSIHTLDATVIEHVEGEEFAAIIPESALRLAIGVIDQVACDKMRMTIQPRDGLLLTIGSAAVTCHLLEGRFPQWWQCRPKAAASTVAKLHAGDLHEAATAAIPFDCAESVRPRFSFEPGGLTISAHFVGRGGFRQQIPIELSGDPAIIPFDPRFFSQATEHLESDQTLLLELDAAGGPARLLDGRGYEVLVMPIAYPGDWPQTEYPCDRLQEAAP